jgi:hypothetical protein
MEFASFAIHLGDRGYSPVPIVTGDRRPLLLRWHRLRTTALTETEIERIAQRHPGAGLGVAGGFNGLVPVDVDTDMRVIVHAVMAVLPKARVGKRGRRGETWFFRDPTGQLSACKFMDRAGRPLVELLVTGQAVIPPTVHPETGRPYCWLTRHDFIDTHAEMLPVITADHVAELKRALRRWMPEPARPSVAPSLPVLPTTRTHEGHSNRYTAYAFAVLASEAPILASMAKDTGRNTKLFQIAARVGAFVAHGKLSLAAVESVLMSACQANGLLDEDGRAACLRSMMSGIQRARNDPLPVLRHRSR